MLRGTAGMVVLLVLAGCAARQPVRPSLPYGAVIREFAIPWENAFPSDVVVDTAGRVWFTDRIAHRIGVFDLATREFRAIMPPTPRSAPYGIINAPDGSLWYGASVAGRLGRIDPATGAITEYVIAENAGGPHQIAWRDGMIWFTLRESDRYGRFDTRTGAVELFEVRRWTRPYSITATAQAVWFNPYGGYSLFEVDPVSGEAREHSLSDALPADSLSVTPRTWRRGEARRLTAAPDGSIWFTNVGHSRVGRYDPVARTLATFGSLEDDTQPYGIALSRAGHVWISERGANRITVIDPVERERVQLPFPGEPAHVRHIAIDEKRRRVWLPFSDSGVLGVVELPE